MDAGFRDITHHMNCSSSGDQGMEVERHTGSWLGHITPGTMFLIAAIHQTLHVYHAYYSARKSSESYRATHGRPLFFCNGKRPAFQQIEAIMRILAVIVGVCGEVITSYNHDMERFTYQMMHAEHIIMFLSFGLSAIIDLLYYHRINCLPSGADYFCGALALFIEFILFMYHLHGRTMLNTHIHTILIYIIGLQIVSTIAEFIYRRKFVWSLPRPLFAFLQGTWFYQIAYTLFNPALGGKPSLDQTDSESVMVVTLYFAVHTIAACAFQFIVGFLVYVAHGRPSTPVLPSYPQYMKLESRISAGSISTDTSQSSASGHSSDTGEPCMEDSTLLSLSTD